MSRPLGFVAVLLLGALALADGDPAAELAVEVEARVVKTAEAELGRVERALRAQAGIDASQVANITLPLQTALEEDLGRGPVKLSPRAIYDACLQRLRTGQSGEQVGRALVELHHKGGLHAAGEPKPAEPKKVPSFLIDKELVRSPEPHLPGNIRPAPGAKLRGMYQICVGTDGKITKVTTVQSIGGADQAIMDHLRTSWLYRPQAVPVCSTRTFVFQFN